MSFKGTAWGVLSSLNPNTYDDIHLVDKEVAPLN